jgi:hypothetical protein
MATAVEAAAAKFRRVGVSAEADELDVEAERWREASSQYMFDENEVP